MIIRIRRLRRSCNPIREMYLNIVKYFLIRKKRRCDFDSLFQPWDPKFSADPIRVVPCTIVYTYLYLQDGMLRGKSSGAKPKNTILKRQGLINSNVPSKQSYEESKIDKRHCQPNVDNILSLYYQHLLYLSAIISYTTTTSTSLA